MIVMFLIIDFQEIQDGSSEVVLNMLCLKKFMIKIVGSPFACLCTSIKTTQTDLSVSVSTNNLKLTLMGKISFTVICHFN